MRGPELHTLFVTRPDTLPATAGRTALAGGVDEVSVPCGDPPSSGGHAAPGVASRRQFASGGYQVHNGRPVAPVVIG